MKKNFEVPELIVVLFGDDDVILTSNVPFGSEEGDEYIYPRP